MERVIKFKAWDEKNKKMVEDISLYNTQTKWNRFSNEVHPTEIVVMQYTGLKDKKGKEIYEGDIIYWKHLGKESAVEVYFNEKEFVFVGKPIDKTDKTESWLDKKCTYLGNIYENPELLIKI